MMDELRETVMHNCPTCFNERLFVITVKMDYYRIEKGYGAVLGFKIDCRCSTCDEPYYGDYHIESIYPR